MWPSFNPFQRCSGMLEKERQIVKKLQDLVEKQRDEIRAKDHELASRSEDVEAVRAETKRTSDRRAQMFRATFSAAVAPDAAGPLDEGQPGPSTQDGSDGGSGESSDPAAGGAGSCSSGSAAGGGDAAAGGGQAETGAGQRGRWCPTGLSHRSWSTSGGGGKSVPRCPSRETAMEKNAPVGCFLYHESSLQQQDLPRRSGPVRCGWSAAPIPAPRPTATNRTRFFIRFRIQRRRKTRRMSEQDGFG